MNKPELCARVAAPSSMSRTDADTAVGAMFATISDTLAAGETVSITGFGPFSTRDRSARTGRNPRTGENTEIDASRASPFKPAKTFRDAVNRSGCDHTASGSARTPARASPPNPIWDVAAQMSNLTGMRAVPHQMSFRERDGVPSRETATIRPPNSVDFALRVEITTDAGTIPHFFRPN